MKNTNKCPKCGSTEIIAKAWAISVGHYGSNELHVETFKKPDAIIFRQRESSAISAWVCGECGFVEFYADSPDSFTVPKEAK